MQLILMGKYRREPPTSALKSTTNRQIKTNRVVTIGQNDKTQNIEQIMRNTYFFDIFIRSNRTIWSKRVQAIQDSLLSKIDKFIVGIPVLAQKLVQLQAVSISKYGLKLLRRSMTSLELWCPRWTNCPRTLLLWLMPCLHSCISLGWVGTRVTE